MEIAIADQRNDHVVFIRKPLEVRDWNTALKRYPTGTHVRATVIRATPDALFFELEPGVFGRVPAYKIRENGYELAQFEYTVMPGSQFDVVVIGAKHTRKDFRLELARTNVVKARPV